MGTTWGRRARHRRRTRLGGVGVVAVAALSLAGAGIVAAAGPALAVPVAMWQVMPTAGDTGAAFYGISCVSASDCTAVGTATYGGSASVAEHYDGTSWTAQTVPATGERTNILNAVSCPAAGQCVAVGDTNAGGLIEQQVSGAWQSVAVPAVTSTTWN